MAAYNDLGPTTCPTCLGHFWAIDCGLQITNSFFVLLNLTTSYNCYIYSSPRLVDDSNTLSSSYAKTPNKDISLVTPIRTLSLKHLTVHECRFQIKMVRGLPPFLTPFDAQKYYWYNFPVAHGTADNVHVLMLCVLQSLTLKTRGNNSGLEIFGRLES